MENPSLTVVGNCFRGTFWYHVSLQFIYCRPLQEGLGGLLDPVYPPDAFGWFMLAVTLLIQQHYRKAEWVVPLWHADI